MPDQDVQSFYDAMAEDYHLIFADWEQSISRQADVLDSLIKHYIPDTDAPLTVLDCTCGIGTQALGLAQKGYEVHATDLSPIEIERAEREAQKMGLSVTFGVADIRTLSHTIKNTFDVVISFDNALPHLLTDSDLQKAAQEIFAVTKRGGLFMASIRDYDALLEEKPQIMPERVLDSGDEKRVMLQHWDWDGELYQLTQFFLINIDNDWHMRYYTTRYRALRRETLTEALQSAGFEEVRWLMLDESDYYQPVVVAKRPT